MRTLDRYVALTVVGSSLVVLAVLVGAFTFFLFVEEAQEVGRGRYGLLEAALYVLFSVPRLSYELFPVAALIGGLIGLGRLAGHQELSVMRAAGVSVRRLVGSVLLGAAVLVGAALLIGEFLAPPSEALALNTRSVALSNEIALKTRYGFWARDGNNYVNIRRVLPGDRVEDIYIYEFDEAQRLRSSTYARSAVYRDGRWELRDIALSTLSEDGRVSARRIDRLAWEAMLRPELVSIVVIKPSSLSIRDLLSYLRYLRANSQNTDRYEQALWVKLTYPAATAAMLLLAVPLVLGSGAGRGGGIGPRVVTGALLGLAFHIANQAAGNLGVLLDLPAALAVGAPTLAVFAAGWLLLQRVR